MKYCFMMSKISKGMQGLIKYEDKVFSAINIASTRFTTIRTDGELVTYLIFQIEGSRTV